MSLSLVQVIDKSLVYTHIIAGCLALLSGVVPMLTHKGGANHRRWGKIYFWSMVYIFVTAQLVQVFFRFNILIFFVANFAFYFAYSGYRTLFQKKIQQDQRPSWLDWLMAIGGTASGICFVLWASSPFWSPALAQTISAPKTLQFMIIGTWLGLFNCFSTISDIIRFVRPPIDKQWWWYQHMQGMLNSYTSALVAVIAVNGDRILAGQPQNVWALWAAPATIGTAGTILWVQYYRRKFSKTSAPPLPALSVGPAARLAALAVLVCALLLGGLSLRAPAALPADAPAADFSALRVLQYIPTISRAVHPIGTPEQAQVRDYLLQQLQALGLQTEVQQTTSVVTNVLGGINVAGSPINLLARLPGTQSRFPIVLVAHYDAPPGSFGANDNGASSGVLLETIRALKAGPPLKNDVVVLIDDGEEIGSIGAQAFVEQHPWAQGGGVALNFDSRGSTGPSMMYETGVDNGAMIPLFAQVPQPFGTSLTNEVYRRLPFQTDFTIFKRAGWSGFNFAYLDGYPYYQSRLDTLQRIDVRSLQHHGSYALALTRYLGMLDERPQPQPDMVYFDLLQRLLVYYPLGWALPLAALAALMFVAVVVWGVRRRHLTYRGVGYGVLGFVGAAVAAPLAVTLLWQIVLQIHPGYQAVLLDVYNNQAYRIAFICLTVALVILIYRWLFQRIALPELAVGSLALWLLLTVATAVAAPGASYLFTLPLLALLIALALLLRTPAPWERPTLGQAALVTLAAVPGILLLFPTTLQLSITLGTSFSGVTSLCIVLLLGLLLIPLRLISVGQERLVWGAALGVAVAGLAYGSLTAGFNAEQPQTSNLFYALDADAHQAHWASESDVLDPWLAGVLEGAEYAPLPTIFAASPTYAPLQRYAPPLPLAGPQVTLLGESESNGVRTVRLRLTSVRQAPIMRITFGKDMQVLSATVNGRPIGDIQTGYRRKSWWELTYFGVPQAGIEMELQFKSANPLEVTVVDRSYGWPEGAGITPRPPESLAAQFPFSIGDVTLVRRAFVFK